MDKDKATEAKDEKKDEKKGKSKLIWVIIITLVLAAGAGTGFMFVWRSMGYLTTDNARVTTTLVAITSNTPGHIERFTIYAGRYVEENEVLGWVEHGEALRSPFDGLVVQSNAVREQWVSPTEPLAVIADINDIHIQANIEETDIARIAVGMPATVTIDPFGNRQFNG
ncbi:MAG: efflux RND transporter periplasmic adaptor subunit, partial [Defluviitaleaceae bacterium]|nr:efflux RND transporter periplasmic adaptor subunit [Defluviitaleaceae bacterium]